MFVAGATGITGPTGSTGAKGDAGAPGICFNLGMLGFRVRTERYEIAFLALESSLLVCMDVLPVLHHQYMCHMSAKLMAHMFLKTGKTKVQHSTFGH